MNDSFFAITKLYLTRGRALVKGSTKIYGVFDVSRAHQNTNKWSLLSTVSILKVTVSQPVPSSNFDGFEVRGGSKLNIKKVSNRIATQISNFEEKKASQV
jgi:hypothetical protein